MNLRSFLLSCCMLGLFSLEAQVTKPDLRNFSIMIIPYLEDNEKISTKLQQDPDLRLAIANLQDAYISNGLRIIDFGARYQKYEQDRVMKDPTSDTKALFVEYASPDIFVELEINHIDCGNKTHKARVRLKTYLTATGELMADRVSDSNCFVKEADYLSLIKQATNKFIEQYITTVQGALTNMVEAGQPLQLHFTIADDAIFDFDSVVKSELPALGAPAPLSKMIVLWMYSEPELIKSFNQSSNSPQEMIIDDLRIPLLDATGKKIYPIGLFGAKLWSFLSGLQLADNTQTRFTIKDSTSGRTIYISLK